MLLKAELNPPRVSTHDYPWDTYHDRHTSRVELPRCVCVYVDRAEGQRKALVASVNFYSKFMLGIAVGVAVEVGAGSERVFSELSSTCASHGPVQTRPRAE